jgi:spermidine/putrescine transport system substrate-binding protein
MAPRVTPPLISRRCLLKSGYIGLLAASGLLAACDSLQDRGPLSNNIDWTAWWRRQRPTGTVDFANWPYYIDRTRDNHHPSLELFTRETGIDVQYYRPIRDNAEFLSRIVPDLAAGGGIGYDIIVITNGPQLSQLIEQDWLVPLDHSRLPNFAEYASPIVRDPIWDPKNRYSVAWQSGFTAVAYRPEAERALGRTPTSLMDLFDPALTGRVGMLSDLLDLGSAGLLALGSDPGSSHPSEWREAATLLQKQRAAGLVRKYYDQGYLDALQRGDIWISQAWSGDIYQANALGHDELSLVVPREGAMFWTDNMLIPRGARHPLDALELMNFVYEPAVAALIADWVWYICPVPAARKIVADQLDDPSVAKSQLVFPTERFLGPATHLPGHDAIFLHSPLRQYPLLDTLQARAEWRQLFGAVVHPDTGPG